jgi:hypothetical protein
MAGCQLFFEGWWGNPWGFECRLRGLERARDAERLARMSATLGAQKSLALPQRPIARSRRLRRSSPPFGAISVSTESDRWWIDQFPLFLIILALPGFVG